MDATGGGFSRWAAQTLLIVECLTADEGYAVLEPYFQAARDVFVENGALRVSKTRMNCAEWAHDSERHVAACQTDGLLIVVAPELAEQPESVVLAILSHELGHAADFLYPAEFLLADDELVRQPEVPDELLTNPEMFDSDDPPALTIQDRAAFSRMSRWESRDHDTVERTADAIAEHFTGKTIGYSGPCCLQDFDGGVRPRPRGLQ